MNAKRTTLYIDDDIAILAKYIGVTNFSALFREMLVFLVSTSGEEMTRTQIREKIKDFTDLKRAELKDAQAEKEKAEELKAKRAAAILESVQKEVALLGKDRIESYLIDGEHFYYLVQRNDLIKTVAQYSGHNVTYADVLAAYKKINADLA